MRKKNAQGPRQIREKAERGVQGTGGDQKNLTGGGQSKGRALVLPASIWMAPQICPLLEKVSC